jgi:tRNA-Thr(GGU) m(6)t(6)A37 methyltransferase TsaA
MEIKPIGIIHSPFKKPEGMPIQPVFAKGAEGIVEVQQQFAQGLKDLQDFERIWLMYWFDRVIETKLIVKPYREDSLRGLFSTRAPCRPNPIGLSPVRLLKIKDNILYVADIDVLDGTPLLDIKPYITEFDCFEGSKCGWMQPLQNKISPADDRFYKKEEKNEKI